MKIFKLPDLGEGLPDAEIVEWHVSVGDKVEAGEISKIASGGELSRLMLSIKSLVAQKALWWCRRRNRDR